MCSRFVQEDEVMRVWVLLLLLARTSIAQTAADEAALVIRNQKLEAEVGSDAHS